MALDDSRGGGKIFLNMGKVREISFRDIEDDIGVVLLKEKKEM